MNFLLSHSLAHPFTHSLTSWCVQSSVAETGYSFSFTPLVEMLRILGRPNFMAKKRFTILNAYIYALFSYSFSFDPSLWWPVWLPSKVKRSFTRIKLPALRNNIPQHVKMFPDSIIYRQKQQRCCPVQNGQHKKGVKCKLVAKKWRWW